MRKYVNKLRVKMNNSELVQMSDAGLNLDVRSIDLNAHVIACLYPH